ncbi:MAG TPA: FG-GAP-like repeat-containing protein [Pyrinomonadaceae bacterium]|nr:FG-GAP-like repeat-containing protein [Pyrinomonadaceae bacterium]
MKKTAREVCFVLIFFIFAFASVEAAPGDLDQTFGVQGRQMVLIRNFQPGGLIWNTAQDIAIQPDGKILVAGGANDSTNGFSYTVTRFNPDGSLDSGFAAGGVFRYDFGTGSDEAMGIALQHDGKIVAAGKAHVNPFAPDTAFGIIRLNPDGTFDSSFGTNGVVITNFFASLDEATEVAIQPDGKIIATGWVTQGGVNNGSTYDFTAVRYNPNGSLDATFGGGDGIAFVDFDGKGDRALSSVLQPDGKIVLAGIVTGEIPSELDFALARLNADGSIDTTFDGDGKTSTTFSPNNLNELARAIALAPDGKLVVTGDYQVPTSGDVQGHSDIAVARYNPNGSLDTSFDGDGKFVYDSNQGDRSEASDDVVVQPDGKILVVGRSHLIQETNPFVAHRDMLVFRLNVNGSFDGSFGSGGRTLTDFGIFNPPTAPTFGSGRTSENGISGSIALQPDGKIVAAGDSWLAGNDRRLAIARFQNGLIFLGNYRSAFDVDGDGKTDIGVFRPSEGNWYILQSADNSFRAFHFGQDNDVPVPADYDGDRKTDIAVVREDVWYILQSSNNGFRAEFWGTSGFDIAVPADYDGDGKADLAFFHFSGNTINDVNFFRIRQSSNNFTRTAEWANQAIPYPRPADYDGDGKADIASYNCFPIAGQQTPPRCEWAILQSSANNSRIEHFGNGNDLPLPPADYDGDGRTDIAVFRPSERVWYLLQSTAGFAALQYGLEIDVPRPSDYDGDGKADITVWRPTDGYWYLLRTSQGFTGFKFGTSGDIPAPNLFVR